MSHKAHPQWPISFMRKPNSSVTSKTAPPARDLVLKYIKFTLNHNPRHTFCHSLTSFRNTIYLFQTNEPNINSFLSSSSSRTVYIPGYSRKQMLKMLRRIVDDNLWKMSGPGSRTEKQRLTLHIRFENGSVHPRGETKTGQLLYALERVGASLSPLVSHAGNTTEFHSLHLEAEGKPCGWQELQTQPTAFPTLGHQGLSFRKSERHNFSIVFGINSSTAPPLKSWSCFPLPSFSPLQCVRLYSSCVCSLIVKSPLYLPSFSTRSWVHHAFQTSEAPQTLTSLFSQ